MKYLLDITPFDEFWFNCYFNNIISVISSFEQSYKYVMYINDYTYKIEFVDSWNTKYLGIDFFGHIGFKNIADNIKLGKCNYAKKESSLQEINELLRRKKVIMPFVDLFHWNKKGIMFRNGHGGHYTLLIGYDDEKKEYYALEDNINQNYGVIMEPENVLAESINSGFLINKDEDYLICNVDNSLPKYSLFLSDIIYNIQITVKSIKLLDFKGLFTFESINGYSNAFFKWQPYVLFQIINRHKANLLLFKKLYQKNIINSNMLNKVLFEIADISDNLLKVRNLIIKGGYLQIDGFQKKYAAQLRELLKYSFNREIILWEYVEDYIESSKLPLAEIDIANEDYYFQFKYK